MNSNYLFFIYTFYANLFLNKNNNSLIFECLFYSELINVEKFLLQYTIYQVYAKIVSFFKQL